MTGIEMLFFGTTLALLGGMVIYPLHRRLLVALLLIACCAGTLAMLQLWPRWQQFPAIAVLLVAAPYAWRRRRATGMAAAGGLVLGLLGVGVSMLLALALPIFELPAPDGPYPVGVSTFPLRSAQAAGNDRQLQIVAWYPAAEAARRAVPRTFWQELYRGQQNVFTFLLRYLSHVPAHGVNNAPLSPEQERYPLLVFSHGLALFPEQNTPLVEHLASNGYIVLAVAHTHLSMRVSLPDGSVAPLDFSRVRAALEEYRQAGESSSPPGMASMMEQWVQDLRQVLDVLTTGKDGGSEMLVLRDHAIVDRIGMFGMSFGGQAVNQICRIDTRCLAGVNIDGAVFGAYQHEPLRVPFLTISSPENERFRGAERLQAQAEYVSVVVAGAKHGDLLDISYALPFLKWLGVTGEIDGLRAASILNDIVRPFFDAQFQETQGWHSKLLEYPDLQVSANGR